MFGVFFCEELSNEDFKLAEFHEFKIDEVLNANMIEEGIGQQNSNAGR